MRTQELDVLSQAQQWLQQHHNVWLCTIVKAVGSSPRPVGSLLACNELGEQCGSLSGGCVEEDLLERLRSGDLNAAASQVIEYGVTAEENERLGLPCGGRLFVLVEHLNTSDRWLDAVVAALNERRCIAREVDLGNQQTALHDAKRFQPLQYDDETLTQYFGPQMRMLLVGAGQLSQSLSELALAMDYEVLVCDPRDSARAQWAGPALPLIGGMPDDAVAAYADDEHSVIITLTHDPRIDDMALMGALESNAWYIGALGSKKTTEKRLTRLRQLDIGEEQLARLHAPVGLSIGSKTPLEIAIAIMAQLTLLRSERAKAERA